MKKRSMLILISIVTILLLIIGGTFAFWSFTSDNKSIVFNTASNLKKYVTYDAGESHFSGTLVVSERFNNGIHSTISVSKSQDASKITLIGTIYMDVNAIGANMQNSSALKWTVTSGTATNVGQVLAQGNFIGVAAGDTLTLYPSFDVSTDEQKYTIWIWLDQAEYPSEALSGETLDTNVWTEINQVEGVNEQFNVTQINSNYQVITATAVNNMHNIDGYKVTTSSSEPDQNDWETIASPSKIYNLPAYSNTQVGETYYVWFKDTAGHTTYATKTVTASDTTTPSCTWGTFNPSSIGNGKTATISLTCTDSGSGIDYSNIKTTNIAVKDGTDSSVNSDKIVISNISKENVTDGYKYTITVTGNSTVDGSAKLVLASDSVKDVTGNGNDSVSSGNITISNVSIITINAGSGISSISGTGLTYDSTSRKATGTFANGSTIDLSSLTITYKTGYSGSSWSKTFGDGTLSGTTFTVGTSSGTLLLNSTTLANPTCTINGGTTKVYNYENTVLTATNSTNYDSGVTLTYQFGYTTTSNGTLGDFVNGTNNTYSVAANSHLGTRYYGVTVTATGNGGLTSTCTTTSGSYTEMTFVNARVDFDATTNGGTISGTTPLYIPYGMSTIYTGRTNTTVGTIPTATKTGYDFDGWYTASSGGTKVVNANGTLVASVTGWTDSSGYWIRMSTSNNQNTNRLYANWEVSSYNIDYDYGGGTAGAKSPSTASYDSTVEISNPTKTITVTGNVNNTGAVIGSSTNGVQTFAGWISDVESNLSSGALSGTTSDSTTLWDGSATTNTYFKNLNGEASTTTLIATWTPVSFNLPTVNKTGYTCGWNTESNGSGAGYYSGGNYTPISNTPAAVTMYANCIDDILPVGNVSTSINGNAVTATLSTTEEGSGISSTYYWKISNDNTCNSTIDDFLSSDNASYNFTSLNGGTYYVCAKFQDNAGNVNYAVSNAINIGLQSTDLSYSDENCLQITALTGNDWYAKITCSGVLTVSTSSVEADAFLVGGGGGGGSGKSGTHASGGGGGSGGAIQTSTITLNSGTYNIVIGNGGSSGTNGSSTTAFGLTASGGGKGGDGVLRYTNDDNGGVGGTVTNGASGGKGSSINKYSKYYSSVAGSDGTIAFSNITYGQYGGGGGGGSAVSINGSTYITGYYEARNSGKNAPGGAGGGAAGGFLDGAGKTAAANTGGGGGGCGSASNCGGTGGSGIILIRPVGSKTITLSQGSNKTIDVLTNNFYSGVSAYCVSTTTDYTGCEWTNTNDTSFTTGSYPNGTYYVHVKDSSNEVTTSDSITIIDVVVKTISTCTSSKPSYTCITNATRNTWYTTTPDPHASCSLYNYTTSTYVCSKYGCSQGYISGEYCFLLNAASCPSGWTIHDTSYSYEFTTSNEQATSCAVGSSFTCSSSTVGQSYVSACG